MAHPNLHKGHAASLFKRGLISQKQHDAMMAKIAAMNAQGQAQAPGSVAPAGQIAPSADMPVTATVPAAQGSLASPMQPPSA